MKTKYLKGITALCFATVLFFSSCLKDARQFLPESVQSNVAEFPQGGLAFFGPDAVTAAGIDTVTFAVLVTAANPPATSTTVNLAVDNTVITAYNAANPKIAYQPIPTAAYKVPGTVTIPAGKNSATTTVIIDRTQLDPAVSYMLPVKIVSATGAAVSANYGIHYFHIIGNDFAGAYLHDYKRYNNGIGPTAGPPSTNSPNNPTVLAPVSPTQFEATTSYVGPVRYEVTFTKGGTASNPTYSNFAVTFNATDVANIWTANGISIVNQPVIKVADPVNKIFEFYYTVFNGSANRYIDDTYHK
ncbi:MAG: DUF1735 domain-containing protein [Bacteroidota bacterium]|nr:DUF1735 domain-containing protein [Bacteroidota bacterium]